MAIVTNLNDSGPGSLRQAIIDTNANLVDNTITFQPGLMGTISLTSGTLPVITDDLVILGPGASVIAVNGNMLFRVFRIGLGVTVSISDLTVEDGNIPGGSGGGIESLGNLTLLRMVLRQNQAGFTGGAIVSTGALRIEDSTIADNMAANGGGLLNSGAGGATIIRSTFARNTASSTGGGVDHRGGAPLSVLNSTISGNSAVFGGGIFNGMIAEISFTTLAFNSAGGTGGGIFATSQTTIKNSIVALSPSGGDCGGSGPYVALGTNFSTQGGCPGFTVVTPAQLNLGPLALNPPGNTETHALLPGSVAIDAAPDCTDVNGVPVLTDQRGVPRPVGLACDVGSYESETPAPPRGLAWPGLAKEVQV